MRTTVLILLLTFGCDALSWAASFNPGSTGAYGPLNITSDTVLDLPADGIFHCTTINIAAGSTLQFSRNPLNTPVYLLATGDVVVAGRINVAGGNASGNAPGAGGPGGFDGGFGGVGVGDTAKGGDGQGPGGGKNQFAAQHAVFGVAVNNNPNVYGNTLLNPLIGGSGGAGADGNPGPSGGGGGGAILLASPTKITINGEINADGGTGASAGSGGGIRLVAPVVGGTGYLHARSSYNGPSGRIRIDCEDRLAYRSLRMEAATVTRGPQLFVFPAAEPRLDILQVAGQSIPEGTGSSVQVTLPPSASPNQTVVVQGRNFTGTVTLAVVVLPDNGPSTEYAAQLSGNGATPAQATVSSVVPVGIQCRVNAWTK